MTKFLLLLGPSGVGKSTIIHELKERDNRFVYISPFITRPLRGGEKDKITVSDEVMDEMDKKGEFLTINKLYGIRYATPKSPIMESLKSGKFPVLDWPVSKIDIMKIAFQDKLITVYVAPPSLDELRKRIDKDNRDTDGHRFREAEEELKSFWAGKFDSSCDLKVVNTEGEVGKIGEIIYSKYLSMLVEGNKPNK